MPDRDALTGQSQRKVVGGRTTPEQRKSCALAHLRQATWEAAQYCALADIERFVAGCIDEIRSDEP